jgi:hypothetical protein
MGPNYFPIYVMFGVAAAPDAGGSLPCLLDNATRLLDIPA